MIKTDGQADRNRLYTEADMAISIMTAFEEKPPQLDFIWPGFLSGTVGALVAPGATGKSFWALEAAMSVACGVTGGDLLRLRPLHAGRVVYLAGEDPELALIRRVHAIGQYFSKSVREAIAANLVLEPIIGKRLNIMDDGHLDGIVAFCAGARLIVLDTLSRIHSLDENKNGDMASLIATLEHVAVSTGASVLYLHHVSKGSAREGQIDQQQAARGASALIDNARWCGFVAKMSEDEAKGLSDCSHNWKPISNDRRGHFVRFGVSKQNYDIAPLSCWYERQEGGVLVAVELRKIRNEKIRSGASRDTV
jgi:RecA-family ATPase